MHAEGLSARKIGNALGGVSRDVVIGRLHRLGLGAPKTRMAATAPHQSTERSVPTLAELVRCARSVSKPVMGAEAPLRRPPHRSRQDGEQPQIGLVCPARRDAIRLAA